MRMHGHILLLALLQPCVSGQSLCPYYCKCLWRSSKITVDCGGGNLTGLPDNIDTSTQVLNMTGSDISVLPGNMFFTPGLTNIQRLYLRTCNIHQINKQAFHGLLNLVEIDLSGNKLHKIPSQSFFTMSRLNTLFLSHNPIKHVPHGAFRKLSRLSKLDLSSCEINSLVFGAFEGLTKLERLNLAGNSLENIEYPDEILLPSLHDLDLLNNPWRCDCHMKDLRSWLGNTLVSTATRIRCFSPHRLKGLVSKSVDLSEFGCKPKITPPTMLLSIPQEKDVALTCQVESDPLAKISWTFDGSPLLEARERISIIQEILSQSKIRSVLSIANVDGRWNGTFACVAENSAGVTTANYTVNVTSVISLPRVLNLKLEYFVAVSVGSLLILVITIVSISITIISVCRRTMKKTQTKERRNQMPRKMKMGTSPTRKLDYKSPDIISDLSHSFYQTQVTSSSSYFSTDTTTTPASLTSSTNAIIQPSKAQYDCQLFNNENKGWTSYENILGGRNLLNSNTGLRREWSSANYFVFPFPQANQTKYPSDFGLPRVSYHENDNMQVHLNNQKNNEVERSVLFPNFSINPGGNHEVPTDKRFPMSQEPNSLLSQEHFYTQIHSLTSGYDHQYESLPVLHQPGINHQDCQEHHLWRYQDRSQNNHGVEEFVSYRDQDINNYKKSLSLPILDDIFRGETEI